MPYRDEVKQLIHRQKLARMVLENKWYESEQRKEDAFFKDLSSSRSKETITYFPKIYYRMKQGFLHIRVEITLGKYQEQLLNLEKKLESGLYCELTDKELKDSYVEYTLLYDTIANCISIEDVQAKYTPKHDCEVGAQAIGCDLATLRLLRAMLDEGRDFLFADAEDLTEIARTGRLGGEEIRRILLPGLDVIRPEALAALRQLKKAGVCVLFAEKLPHIDALSGQQLQLAGEFEAVSVQEAVQIPDAQEPQFKTLSGPIVRQARYRTRDSKSMFFLLNPGRTEAVVRLPGADARRCTALDPFTGTITQERLNRDWTVPAVRGIFIIIEE